MTKLNADGSGLVYSTYLGNDSDGEASTIALDRATGEVFVAGWSGAGLPLVAPIQQRSGDATLTGLVLSEDGGDSWDALPLLEWRTSSISPNPAREGDVLVPGYRSTDGGETWSAVGTCYSPTTFVRAPSDPDIVYCSGYSEVYRSVDGGTSWNSFSGNGYTKRIDSLAVHPSDPYMLFSMQPEGLYRLYPEGNLWQKVSSVPPYDPFYSEYPHLLIDPSNPDVMYTNLDWERLGGLYGSILKSLDGGQSWADITGVLAYSHVDGLILDETNPETLYASLDGFVYKTTNGGTTWQYSSHGVEGVTSLSISRSDPLVLYAGTQRHGVYRSGNGGATWLPANNGINTASDVEVAVDPFDSNRVYAGKRLPTDSFIARLNSNGTSLLFSTILGGVDSDSIAAIALDGSGNVYVAGETSSPDFPLTTEQPIRYSRGITSYYTSLARSFLARIDPETAPCTYRVSPDSVFLYPEGETLLFSVIAPSGCEWTAQAIAGWTPIGIGESGTGTASVAITVPANTGPERTTNLQIAGKNVTVTQAAGTCEYDFSVPVLMPGPAGGTVQVDVITGEGCPWEVTSGSDPRVQLSATSGVGSSTITVEVTELGADESRRVLVSFGMSTLLVVQPGSECSVTLGQSSVTVSGAGGEVFVQVNAETESCEWRYLTEAKWLGGYPFLGGSHLETGTQQISFTAEPNTSGEPRTGTVYIAGNVLTVTQSSLPRDLPGLYVPDSGMWFLRKSQSDGVADLTFQYGPGGLGWIPLVGDWDGDGTDTPGLYDPASGVWFLRNSYGAGAADLMFQYGPAGVGWTPLVGDWDGDGMDTPGLYNPVTGMWFLRNQCESGAADLTYSFGPGGLGWTPLVGDWDGDGADTAGLYVPDSGSWFLRNEHGPGAADATFPFGPGGLGWLPLAGDWNADGTTTAGLYDPASGLHFLRNSHAAGPADTTFSYGPGGLGWLPISGAWPED